jgi:hypothetical protein
MPTVLQKWMLDIPIKMQSTLILGLRGPDTHACPEVKKICRWLRSLSFLPGDPTNVPQFMGEMPDRIIEKSPINKELEFCTQHFYIHLMHALEVVAYRHPDPKIASHAYLLMGGMCHLLHLESETHLQFEFRLRTLEWPGGSQPDNFEEAMKLITKE